MRSFTTKNKTRFTAGLFLSMGAAATLSACDSASLLSTQPAETLATRSAAQTESLSPGHTGSHSGPTVSRRKPQALQQQHTYRLHKTSETVAQNGARSLRAAFIKSRQADGGAAYAAQPRKDGAYHFESTAKGIGGELGLSGVRVAVEHNGVHADASFHLVNYGCDSNPGERLGAVRPLAQGQKVSYARPSRNIVEWYQNGPLGLEQGFELHEAPSCRAAGKDEGVVLKMELAHGLQASLQKDAQGGQWLALQDQAGREVLRYSDLYGEDAAGQIVPTRMALEGDVLTLHVDDHAARYPISVDPLIWTPLGAAVTASDASKDAHFGTAIAISGDHAIVGAPADGEGGANAGAAYIFTLNNQGVWTERVKLIGQAADEEFGSAVAIDDVPGSGGDKRLVIGAPKATNGGGPNSGRAVWFRGRADTFLQESEFSNLGLTGAAVAAFAGRVFVGEPELNGGDGGIAVFEFDASLPAPPWSQVDIAGTSGSGEKFGTSIAVDNDFLAIGAPHRNLNVPNAGAVYVFARAGNTFIPAPTPLLQASDRAGGDQFGNSVAIAGSTIVVGAPARGGGVGGAYIFINQLGSFGEQDQLHSVSSLSLAAGDNFGNSVSIAGNLVAVGAAGTATGRGATYLFRRTTTGGSAGTTVWTQAAGSPLNATTTSQQSFGNSVVIDRGLAHILAASAFDDAANDAAGAFYDLVLRNVNGDSCASGTQCASGFCTDGVCCNSACGGSVANDCQSCLKAQTKLANDGTCGPIAAASAFACRPSVNSCDTAEVCDGTSTICPADTFQNTACPAEADLGISISAQAATTTQQPLNVSIAVFNAGTIASQNLTVTITVPAGATVQSAIGSNWTCTTAQTTATCKRDTLAADEVAIIAAAVAPPSGVDTISITATVASQTVESKMSNNSATLNQNVLTQQLSGGGCVAAPSSANAQGLGILSMMMGLALLGLRRRRVR